MEGKKGVWLPRERVGDNLITVLISREGVAHDTGIIYLVFLVSHSAPSVPALGKNLSALQ